MKHAKIGFRILYQIFANNFIWSKRSREYILPGNPDITITLGREKPNSAKPESSIRRGFRNSTIKDAYAHMGEMK